MRKTFYTFWVLNPVSEEMILLTEENQFFFKRNALRHARKISKERQRDIYVRKITIGSYECLEWKIEYQG